MNFTPENFCYWLQGYFEIAQHQGPAGELTKEAVQEIKNHLALVFKKETPKVRLIGEQGTETIIPITRWPGTLPGSMPIYQPQITCTSDTREMKLGTQTEQLREALHKFDFSQTAIC